MAAPMADRRIDDHPEVRRELVRIMRVLLDMADDPDTLRDCANACITALAEICEDYVVLETERDKLVEVVDAERRYVKELEAIRTQLTEQNQLLRNSFVMADQKDGE